MSDDRKKDFTDEELRDLLAREHGAQAFVMGATPNQNPYEPGTIAHSRWLEGWREAEDTDAFG